MTGKNGKLLAEIDSVDCRTAFTMLKSYIDHWLCVNVFTRVHGRVNWILYMSNRNRQFPKDIDWCILKATSSAWSRLDVLSRLNRLRAAGYWFIDFRVLWSAHRDNNVWTCSHTESRTELAKLRVVVFDRMGLSCLTKLNARLLSWRCMENWS